MYRHLRLTGPLQRALDRTVHRAPPAAPWTPEREYMILFTPRSGSSHLARLLTSAGVGDCREWLNPRFLAGQAEFFGVRTFADYFAAMRRRYSPGGVFGHKMTIWFYRTFSREVRLEDHFDFAAPKVLLYREDIVQQAVSLAAAQDRKVFHRTAQTPAEALPPVPYRMWTLRRYVALLAHEEARLQALADRHGGPLRYVSYETLTSQDPAAAVAAIAALAGAAADLGALASDHRKLGDRTNLEHAERFAREQPRFLDSIRRRREPLMQRAAGAPLV